MSNVHMIGNSHIDPVWFWDWSEGMQEVKATFSSVLDRLREDKNFTFTATSSAFFEWIKSTSPEMFSEIKYYVNEGRFSITGGWYIESDCILPCGEAMVRQGLYGQRFFKETLGIKAEIGSNVDSFGHNPSIPQILKKSGMDNYVFMRPRLVDTPVFKWESADGSQVKAVSLPSEYTTWFYESTKEGIQMAEAATNQVGLSTIPCCYGVGNHGGGPTKANIQAIYQLQKELPETLLSFSNFKNFFEGLTEEESDKLTVRKDFFDKVNTGCYSVDGAYKLLNRETERRLIQTDFILAIEQMVTGHVSAQEGDMAKLWKRLLFNQFHDTLGGTCTKPARDEAAMSLAGVCGNAKEILTLSLQRIVNKINTVGEGFPLFLFNPTGSPFSGTVEVEVDWFCKDGLKLLDNNGNEIPYQRTYTNAKTRNYNLGGRRSLVFHADILACGFVVFRAVVDEPEKAFDIRNQPEFPLLNSVHFEANESPYILENGFVRVEFNKRGFLEHFIDKKTGFDSLQGAVSFPIWDDQRDTWGGLQDTLFGPSGKELVLKKIETVESGPLRKIVRAVYGFDNNTLSQTYILNMDSPSLVIKNTLIWNKEWAMLNWQFPTIGNQIISDHAFGIVNRQIGNNQEYSMHKFLDVTNQNAGLLISNNGKYCFRLFEGQLQVPLCRSSIYAQGNGKGWYNPVEGYDYTDIGRTDFTLKLVPHGDSLSNDERLFYANHNEESLVFLLDNIHFGKSITTFEGLHCESRGVRVESIKQGEEGSSRIIRLLEVNGQDSVAKVVVNNQEYHIKIGHNEILSIAIDLIQGTLTKINLIEEGVD